jgi:hypothetical protein
LHLEALEDRTLLSGSGTFVDPYILTPTASQGESLSAQPVYAKVTLGTSGSLTAQVQPSAGAVTRLSLLDNTGSKVFVQSDGQPGSPNDLITQSLPAGTYLLEVTQLSGSTPASATLTTTFTAGNLPGSPLAIAPNTESMVSGDFGNGHTDVALLSAQGKVTVFLGNGDGTFQPGTIYSLGAGVVSGQILAVDLGNGSLDLVVGSAPTPFASGKVWVLVNNGTGAFASSPALDTVSLPSSSQSPVNLVSAVLPNGKVGVVGIGLRPNNVTVISGNGSGGIVSTANVNLGVATNAVAAVDLGNGKTDIVTANADGTVSVLVPDTLGAYAVAATYTMDASAAADRLVIGAFHGGNTLDIATANSDGTVSILRGNGNGTFTTPAASFSTGGSASATPVDLIAANFGNGQLDLAVAYSDGLVSVLDGNGTGGFLTPTTFQVGPQINATPVLMTNMDLGNGQLDLVVVTTDGNASVLLGNGDGTFQAPKATLAGTFPAAMAVANLGTGHPDLMVANNTFPQATLSVLFGNGDGTFQTPPANPTGTQAIAMATGDFGNGLLDIATANATLAGTVSILLGDGNGGFLPPVSYSVGGQPTAIETGDFNHDGRLDLAVATTTGVSILLGNGDGSFQAPAIYSISSDTPDAIAEGDFDGDGITDLAVFSQGGTVSLLHGVGDGTFTFGNTYTVGNLPISPVVANLGNGHLDIAVANELDGTVSVLLGDGAGNFTVNTYLVGSLSADLIAAHLRNANTLDLATANGDGTVSVLLNNGGGTFSTGGNFATVAGSSATSIAAGNFGNGFTDLAVTTSDNFTHAGNIAVLLGNGSGSFASGGTYAVGKNPTALLAADFGNGAIDLAAANQDDGTVSVLVNQGNGTGTFQAAATYQAGTNPDALAAGDFGNGHLDLAVKNTNAGAMGTVTVLLGNGDGTFVPSSMVNAAQATPLLADFTGDGVLDSVVVAQNGSILYRPGTASGSFGSAVVVNASTNPARAAAIVNTSTGYLIAALDEVTKTISLYQRTGTSTFQRVAILPAGDLATRILSGDFTGAGRTDLAVLNSGDGTVTVYLANSSGGFLAPQTINVGLGASAIALVRDATTGAPDLLVTNQSTGGVAVLVNNGNGVFTNQGEFRAGAGPYSLSGNAVSSLQDTVGVIGGNLSGTGTMGIVTINAGANTFGALVGQGGSSFANPLVAGLGISPAAIASGDFNGDGRLDFAVLDKASGTISVWLGNGDGTFTQTGAPLAAGNSPTGLSVADVNGDSVPDLLVGNVYGDILVLLGNGNGTFRSFVRTDPRVPFVVKDMGNGVPSVILANRSLDDVLAQIRTAGTTNFSIGNFQQYRQNGLIGPGYITLAKLTSSGFDDLVVANTGSNNILVYVGTGPNTFSTTPLSFFAGTNPVFVAVGDLNGDGVPDLAVANQGSNDVSILLGNGDGTFHYGPRLNAGGLGTNYVQIGNFTNRGLPDLLVTNGQSGTATLLPAIGSGGVPTGFFNDTSPVSMNLGQPILATVANGSSDLALRQDGSIVAFDPTNFAAGAAVSFGASNIIVLSNPVGGSLAVGESDNSVAVLTEDSAGRFAESLVFRDARLDNPSALEFVGSEIYVTNAGSNEPIIIELSAGIPVAISEGGVGRGLATELGSAGSEITLVAILSTGQSTESFFEGSIDNSLVVGLGTFMYLPRQVNGAGSGGDTEVANEGLLAQADVEGGARDEWTDLVFGVRRAIQQRSQEAQRQLINYEYDPLHPDPTPEHIGPIFDWADGNALPSPADIGVVLSPNVDSATPRMMSEEKTPAIDHGSSRGFEGVDWSRPAPVDAHFPILPTEVLAPAVDLWSGDGRNEAPSPALDPVARSGRVAVLPPDTNRDLAWAGLLAVLLPIQPEEKKSRVIGRPSRFPRRRPV